MPNHTMNETSASAIESRPSANRVRLPVVVEITTSAIPIPSSVHTDTHAARFPSSKAFDLSLTKKQDYLVDCSPMLIILPLGLLLLVVFQSLPSDEGAILDEDIVRPILYYYLCHHDLEPK